MSDANIPRIGVIRDPSTWVQDLAGSRAYEDPPEIDYYNHEHLVSTRWLVDELRSRICPRGEPWTGPKDSTDKWYFDHGHTDCYQIGWMALRLEQLQARVDAAGTL